MLWNRYETNLSVLFPTMAKSEHKKSFKKQNTKLNLIQANLDEGEKINLKVHGKSSFDFDNPNKVEIESSENQTQTKGWCKKSRHGLYKIASILF